MMTAICLIIAFIFVLTAAYRFWENNCCSQQMVDHEEYKGCKVCRKCRRMVFYE